MMRIPRKAPFIYVRWSDGGSVLMTSKKDITQVCVRANEKAHERFPSHNFMCWDASRTVARGKISKLKIGYYDMCSEWILLPPMDEELTEFFMWCQKQLQEPTA